VTTTSGHCGKIKVGLAISRGRISSTSGSFALHRIRIDGLISGAGGQTRMTAVAGPRVAKGSGRFIRSQGQGKWSGTGPSGVCFLTRSLGAVQPGASSFAGLVREEAAVESTFTGASSFRTVGFGRRSFLL